MTHISFLSWLKGLLEISNTQSLGEKEIAIIKEHLNLAFSEKPELNYYLQGFFETFDPDYLGNGELGRIKAAVQGEFNKVTGPKICSNKETSGLDQIRYCSPSYGNLTSQTQSSFSSVLGPYENKSILTGVPISNQKENHLLPSFNQYCDSFKYPLYSGIDDPQEKPKTIEETIPWWQTPVPSGDFNFPILHTC